MTRYLSFLVPRIPRVIPRMGFGFGGPETNVGYFGPSGIKAEGALTELACTLQRFPVVKSCFPSFGLSRNV